MKNVTVLVFGAVAAMLVASCHPKAPPPADEVIEQPDTTDECPRADGNPCL